MWIPVHPHPRGDNENEAGADRSPLGSPPFAWGQHYVFHADTEGYNGSPPPAWGQLHVWWFRFRPSRFTPTRVGTTTAATTAPTLWSVHPHPRGDNAYRRARSAARSGSPPPAWGQRSRIARRKPNTRFTPTRVGTTLKLTTPAMMSPVHPHPRGDNC